MTMATPASANEYLSAGDTHYFRSQWATPTASILARALGKHAFHSCTIQTEIILAQRRRNFYIQLLSFDFWHSLF